MFSVLFSRLPYFCANNIKSMNLFLLQTAVTSNTTANYLPIALQLLFALGFVVITLGATHLLGPSRKTADKLENFESGIESMGMPASRWPLNIFWLLFCLFCLMWK